MNYNVYQGRFVQRGNGLGSIFSGFMRYVMPAAKFFGKKIISSPITKNIVNTAKKSAIQAGLSTVQDIMSGENVGQSLKRNLSRVGDDVLETASKELMSGSGARKRKLLSLLKELEREETPAKRKKKTPKKKCIKWTNEDVIGDIFS